MKVLYHGQELGLAISHPASATWLLDVQVLWHFCDGRQHLLVKVKPQSNVTVGADVTIKLDAAMFQEHTVKRAKFDATRSCCRP